MKITTDSDFDRALKHNIDAAVSMEELFDIFDETSFEDWSQESVQNFLFRLVEVGTRFLTEFRVRFFGIFQNVPYTEIESWRMARISTWQRIKLLSYPKLADQSIFIPFTMTIPYPSACSAINNCMTILSATMKIKQWKKEIAKIIKIANVGGDLNSAISDNGKEIKKAKEFLTIVATGVNGANAKTLDDVYGIPSDMTKKAMDQLDTIDDYVTIKTGAVEDRAVAFKTVFANKKQFGQTFGTMLANAKYARRVSGINGFVNTSYRKLIEPVEYISKHVDQFTREGVQALAVYMRNISTLIDMYGYTAASEIVVEHNFVLSLNRLSKNILGM